MTTVPRPLWIARVAGSQREMGHHHGALLAQAGGAEATFDHYRTMPSRLLAGDLPALVRPAATLAVRGAVEALLVRLDAARPPELRERSRAFLGALGLPRSWSRYLAVMDLFQNAVGVASRLALGPFARPAGALMQAAAQPACSTVVTWGAASVDGAVRHARNFDFPGIGVWDAAPALVMCHPERGQRYAFLSTRGADAPVVTVWNQAGLVFTTHTRFHRAVRWNGSTIVDLIHDLARRAETLDDVVAMIDGRKVASTWGIAVSSAHEQRALSIETHADGHAVVASRSDHLIVANRYRDPAMQDGELTAAPGWALHTDRRELRLAGLVAEARAAGGADVAALVAMLTDRRDPDDLTVERQLGAVVAQPCQVHSVVVEAARNRVTLGAAAAPVGEGAWLTLDLDWNGTPGAWELGSIPSAAGVAVSPGPVRPRAPASDAVAHALALEATTHDPQAIAAALTTAVLAAPADPSLRQALMWTAMQTRQWRTACEHAGAGLARERLPYRRGQLLLWGARAATAAGDDTRARQWRDELAALPGADLAPLREDAARDATRPTRWFLTPPQTNLLLLEAYR